eukprot:SAG22_NODE_1161_length_5307_cov_55.889593_5_plen_301_part_00
MYCTTPNCLTYDSPYLALSVGWGNINFELVNTSVQQAINKTHYECGDMCTIDVVNLGDEIGVAAPPSYANDSAFEAYCAQHHITLDELGCECVIRHHLSAVPPLQFCLRQCLSLRSDPTGFQRHQLDSLHALRHERQHRRRPPGPVLPLLQGEATVLSLKAVITAFPCISLPFLAVPLLSQPTDRCNQFSNSAGIAYFANTTKWLGTLGLDGAKFGANFSPGNYVGNTFMYVRLFRERAFTLPWSEDWIWQIPVGSQQVMPLILDAFRSGMQWLDQPDFAPGTVAPPPPADWATVYPKGR